LVFNKNATRKIASKINNQYIRVIGKMLTKVVINIVKWIQSRRAYSSWGTVKI